MFGNISHIGWKGASPVNPALATPGEGNGHGLLEDSSRGLLAEPAAAGGEARSLLPLTVGLKQSWPPGLLQQVVLKRKGGQGHRGFP